MRRPVGRPRKYAEIIDALDDDTLYSPAAIVKLAKDEGLLAPFLKEGDEDAVMGRVRASMIQYSQRYFEEGDGQVKFRGQAPMPAWFGWRWKTGRES